MARNDKRRGVIVNDAWVAEAIADFEGKFVQVKIFGKKSVITLRLETNSLTSIVDAVHDLKKNIADRSQNHVDRIDRSLRGTNP